MYLVRLRVRFGSGGRDGVVEMVRARVKGQGQGQGYGYGYG